MNKNILVSNLAEDSVVSQKIVYDSINCFRGLSQVSICRRLLTSVSSSRKKCQSLLHKKTEMLNEENKRKLSRDKLNES